MWKPASSPTKPTTPEPEKSAKPAASTFATPSGSEPAPAATTRAAVVTSSQEQASIGKSLVIKGEVTGSESLYIDGRVEGAVNLPGHRVTIGRNGQVTANVSAKEVVVLGKIKGNVTASDRVDIRNEGSVHGDVACQRICIEDGAFFKGSIDIGKSSSREQNGAASTETSKLAVNA